MVGPRSKLEDVIGGNTLAGEERSRSSNRATPPGSTPELRRRCDSSQGRQRLQHDGINALQAPWPVQLNVDDGRRGRAGGLPDPVWRCLCLVQGEECGQGEGLCVLPAGDPPHHAASGDDSVCPRGRCRERWNRDNCYPVSDVVLRHEAGVSEPATSVEVAYVGRPKTMRGPSPRGSFVDLLGGDTQESWIPQAISERGVAAGAMLSSSTRPARRASWPPPASTSPSSTSSTWPGMPARGARCPRPGAAPACRSSRA